VFGNRVGWGQKEGGMTRMKQCSYYLPARKRFVFTSMAVSKWISLPTRNSRSVGPVSGAKPVVASNPANHAANYSGALRLALAEETGNSQEVSKLDDHHCGNPA